MLASNAQEENFIPQYTLGADFLLGVLRLRWEVIDSRPFDKALCINSLVWKKGSSVFFVTQGVCTVFVDSYVCTVWRTMKTVPQLNLLVTFVWLINLFTLASYSSMRVRVNVACGVSVTWYFLLTCYWLEITEGLYFRKEGGRRRKMC